MQEPAQQRRPVLLSAAQVCGVVVVHGVVMACVIGWLGVTEREVGPLPRHWAVVALIPSLAWTALVLGRTAAWRRASSFWLAGAAAIIAILAFVSAMVLRFGPLDLPGVGFGMLVSSWILIAVALVFAFATQLVRTLRGRAAPRTADREAPGTEPSGTDAAGTDAFNPDL